MHAELRFWLPRRLLLGPCEVKLLELIYSDFPWQGLVPSPTKGGGENRSMITAIMSDENKCFREVSQLYNIFRILYVSPLNRSLISHLCQIRQQFFLEFPLQRLSLFEVTNTKHFEILMS